MSAFSASDEYDYFHLGGNLRFEHDFNMKNTTAFIGLAYGQDEIKPVGGAPIGLTPMVASQDDGGDDDKARATTTAPRRRQADQERERMQLRRRDADPRRAAR